MKSQSLQELHRTGHGRTLERGVVGLLHPDGIYDDTNGGTFRQQSILVCERIYHSQMSWTF